MINISKVTDSQLTQCLGLSRIIKHVSVVALNNKCCQPTSTHAAWDMMFQVRKTQAEEDNG